MNPVLSVLIDRPIIIIPCGNTASGGSQYNTRPCSKIAGEFQPRLPYGLRSSHQGELREAIIEDHLLAIKATFRFKIAHLAADLNRKTIDVTKVQLTDSAAPFAHGLEGFSDRMPQRIDGPGAGNHNAFHRKSFCPRPAKGISPFRRPAYQCRPRWRLHSIYRNRFVRAHLR